MLTKLDLYALETAWMLDRKPDPDIIHHKNIFTPIEHAFAGSTSHGKIFYPNYPTLLLGDYSIELLNQERLKWNLENIFWIYFIRPDKNSFQVSCKLLPLTLEMIRSRKPCLTLKAEKIVRIKNKIEIELPDHFANLMFRRMKLFQERQRKTYLRHANIFKSLLGLNPGKLKYFD